MRTDEIAPRGSLTKTDSPWVWPLFNPAHAGLGAAFIAGLFAEVAFQRYQEGLPFREWWREVFSVATWIGMAIVAVLRGLKRVRKKRAVPVVLVGSGPYLIG
ncbi:MAG: hypothetical protein ABSH39_07965 [Candidatus Acidiferrum sp.]|jgi:hypothetical protein